MAKTPVNILLLVVYSSVPIFYANTKPPINKNYFFRLLL